MEEEHYPCITRPTRLTHHSATLIDNSIVLKHLHCKQHSGIVISDLSDHLPCLSVFSNMKKGNKIHIKIKKRNLSDKKINDMVK